MVALEGYLKKKRRMMEAFLEDFILITETENNQ